MEGLNAELHLVGEGPQKPALEALVKERGLPVRFLGRVANQDLPTLLRQATVFALPSKGEHHPKALIEAMACGAAVLGSDAPGIREIIAPQSSGLLCGLAAPDIHQGLSRLLGDADLRARLGDAARQQMVADFSFQRVLDLELCMLSELIG
jgi:glycosyltransferase involved in cell wall biosynthesis